jgi:hypothetical protein
MFPSIIDKALSVELGGTGRWPLHAIRPTQNTKVMANLGAIGDLQWNFLARADSEFQSERQRLIQSTST